MVVVRAAVKDLARIVEIRDDLAEQGRHVRDPELDGLVARRRARLDFLPDQAAQPGPPPEQLEKALGSLGSCDLPDMDGGHQILEDRAGFAAGQAPAADVQEFDTDMKPGSPRELDIGDDPDLRKDVGVRKGVGVQEIGVKRPASAQRVDPRLIGHDGADTLQPTDHRQLGEMIGGPPQCLPRNAELGAKVGFARQHLAGAKSASSKRRLEPVHHLQKERQDAVLIDRFELGNGV